MTIQQLINELNSIDDKDNEVIFYLGQINDDSEHKIIDVRSIDDVFEKDFAGKTFLLLQSK